jgi:GDPmannose 4,6-dehydratase
LPEQAREQLGWAPRIGFQELVEEMMREDLKEAERDALCQAQGSPVLARHE